MDIIIDFDGTVVTHEFPNVGKDIGAVPVLKMLIEKGHNLILFTMRSNFHDVQVKDDEIHPEGGDYLTEALKWFDNNEIKLYGVQTNPTQHLWTTSPKAYGKLIIDDAALGCPLIHDKNITERPFVDWNKVKDYLTLNGII
jgi:hypothetical protein